MSGVGEAGLVLGIISSIISIVTAAKELYDAANDANSLPKAFHNVATNLDLILALLREAEEFTKRPDVDPSDREAFGAILVRCQKSADELREIFARVIPKEGATRLDRYWAAAKKVGKGGRVEELSGEILQQMTLLSTYHIFREATQKALARAQDEISRTEASLLEDAGQQNNPFRVKTLKEIKYNASRLGPTSTLEQNPKLFLYTWLLPESLPVPNSASDHAFYLGKRFHNPQTSYSTFEWFFNTSEYLRFIDPNVASVLRIKGSSGCGKSVLASAMIDKIQKPLPGAESTLVLYCYAHRDPEPTGSMTLVRMLLAQTLQWENPQFIPELSKFYSKNPVLRDYDSKVEDELWTLLRTVLAHETQKVYIIVDGLDECAQPLMCARLLVNVTTGLAKTKKSGLLLSSRLQNRDVFDNKNIQASLSKRRVESSQLEITRELTRQDVSEFVSHRVNSHISFSSKSIKFRGKIIDGVCERANGMFLYASLILEDLRGDKISSISAIEESLGDLPTGLFNSYRNNIEIPKRSRKGSEVFSWIFCSNPALSWHELKSVLAIGDSGYDEDELVDDSCERFIGHSCGQLVEAFGESERLRFIHPTVKDFLAENRELGIHNAHSMIAGKLLTFLEYSDLPPFSSPDIDDPGEIIKTYSLRDGRGLYSYATFNWFKHLKESEKSENVKLESQVLGFIVSPALIRWLKSAIIMSHVSGDGRDAVSLTADVIDSLQGWSLGRNWVDDHSAIFVQSWIKHFLQLMLDWGKVLETQPDWIHYLHHQLLSETNVFREILGDDGDQSVIQFRPEQVLAKSSEPITWPNRCFAMDQKRDLAFTYDEPFISCYHMQTGLNMAEILIPIPTKVRGPLVARKGVLCAQGKHLAVIFEAMGPSTDAIGAGMRSGLQLHMKDSLSGFAWRLEHSTLSDMMSLIGHVIYGIDHAEFVVCLLKLRHEGPARTHLFGLPSWATTPVLTIGTQSMRWELDDVDALAFSEDSSRLVTPFGIFDIESGESSKPWSFALNLLYHGGKLAGDLETFGTVRRTDDLKMDSGSVIELHDVRTSTSRQMIELPGIVHLLSISNHGRFLVLLRVQIFEGSKKALVKKGKATGLRPQQGSIGVWDCHENGSGWTPLLILDPPSSKKLRPWNLCPYTFPSSISPEAIENHETNRLLVYVPSEWKLAANVRNTTGVFETRGAHILMFEAEKPANLATGFGKHPKLKLQLPATAFSQQETIPDLWLRILSWSPRFDTATIYGNSGVQTMTHEKMKESISNIIESRTVGIDCHTKDPDRELKELSVLLASPGGSATYNIRVSFDSSESENQSLVQRNKPSKGSMSVNDILGYEISVASLMAGETEAASSTIKHTLSPQIQYPPLETQYICVTDENHISLGCLELDVYRAYDGMELSIKDPNDSIFQRALKAFERRAHPLHDPNPSPESVALIKRSPNSRYSIFDNTELHFDGTDPLSTEDTDCFLIKGSSSEQENLHVFQFSRRLDTNRTKDRNSEARQWEVYLCVYDAELDNISWLLHTNTGGEISGSMVISLESSWALHPQLPLLVWLLPGHRLRISNIESHHSPVTIAEPLTIECDSTQAIKFSPNGRYVVVQGRESFRNDFMSMRQNRNLWNIVLCDLVEGKTIGASLHSESTLSIDLTDDFLCTYRLTRDGAVESSLYSLPDMALSKRQHLTFIPAHCSCSTCGQHFEPHCTISIMEYQGVKSVVLGHNAVNIGFANVGKGLCEPLILRITSPPVDLNLLDIRDAVFTVLSSRPFPKILNEREELLDDAFAASRQVCPESCSCHICTAEALSKDNPIRTTRIIQMETIVTDFKLASGKQLPLGEAEAFHRTSEADGIKALSVWNDVDLDPQRSLNRIKRAFGEEHFPWENWTEFRENMEEIKDEWDYDAYMKMMFKPGACGIGCKIPVFVYTFCFNEDGLDGDSDDKSFHWSCSKTIGWLEEDIEWLYDRFFGGDFSGARRWYTFTAYDALSAKMDGLKADNTEKGRRYRKYFSSHRENVLEVPLPEKKKVKKNQTNDDEAEDDDDPKLPTLIMKDVFESMSDLVPGLGKIFEQRLHTMLNSSLFSVDGDLGWA